MADLHDMVAFMDAYLAVDNIADYCPKGLQVEGAKEVTRVVTGVSACMPLFERAVEESAQMVLVHHGMFWDGDSKVVRGSLKQRLKFLLSNDLSLLGYHLPLDAHPEVGNNAQIFDRLGLSERTDFGVYKGQAIACMGTLPEPLAFDDFLSRVNAVFGGDAFHLPFGPDTVQTVAICSGGAPDLVREAIDRRADVYLTGEASEYVYHLAKEEGIHYIGAGHHATERFGVMALGEKLAAEFGVECRFVDIPNPI
ncbi:MAG: Nif3-like dinuclear metal center hexameric protein [Leptospirillia bacterium]